MTAIKPTGLIAAAKIYKSEVFNSKVKLYRYEPANAKKTMALVCNSDPCDISGRITQSVTELVWEAFMPELGRDSFYAWRSPLPS